LVQIDSCDLVTTFSALESHEKIAVYLAGDVEKASQLLVAFRTELERPQIATYYGVILAGSSNFAPGAKFLDLEAKANLLLEERQLVEKAQLTIARR
jgi:hypothetical protein